MDLRTSAVTGELFNPVFIGRHNQFELLGFDMARRERDPVGLVDAMIAENGPLPGVPVLPRP